MAIFAPDDEKNKLYPHMALYTDFVKRMERPLVGRDKEMKQLLEAMLRPELCNVILLADAGSGKALANDTLIPVADDRGYVAIKDLKSGDIVFDQNGVPVKVLGVYPQGMLDAYRVTFTDHTSVICNDDHIWGARKYHERGENKVYHEVTLREIMNYGICKEVPRKKGKEKRMQKVKCWYVPISAPVQREAHEFKIHPYVMGVLIGDGCLTDRPLSISSNDEDVIKQVAMLLGASGYHKSVYNYTWTFEDANGKWKTDKSGPTRKYIQTSDLVSCGDYECVFGRTSDEKRIPREYFLGSVPQRYALLQGLMDTNGCIINDKRANCSYSTTSLGLVEDVIELANSLGIRATYTVSDRERDNRSTEYSVHFSLEPERKKDLFSLSRKRNIAISHEREYCDKRTSRKIYDDISIDSVEKLPDKMDMTCIYVDSPDHLFLAGKNHIVTHNTALVQGTMAFDRERSYLEVSLSKMIGNATNNENEIADMLKQLFDEVQQYSRATGHEIVLFIDEFHQIVQLSSAAVEVMKPLLADSGTRGIKVIAATTYIEFQEHIAANLPLVERLQRINLGEPDKKTVVAILKGMADRYGVLQQFDGDIMFENIYDYTNQYIPANAQPRKSILMLDSMIGKYRYSEAIGLPRRMDMRMLADVIYETEGFNIAFNVNVPEIRAKLNEAVIAQEFAVAALESRLQICCAGLNNKNKPMASFLFTGSTGVGKTEMTKQLAKVLFGDESKMIRMDMTEFALDDSLNRFREELTAKVWAHPHSVVLLDEIEKACAPVTRLLLQVLDDGRLIDRHNREVTFKNTYIVVTTNAGSEIYRTISQYNADDKGSGEVLERYDKLIRDSIVNTTGDSKFPPELLGRIDRIVPFQPLSENTMGLICRRKLLELGEKVFRQHNCELDIDNFIIRYIVQEKLTTDSDAGGARGVITRIEREVVTPVSAFINAVDRSRLHNNKVYVQVVGEMAVDNKSIVHSDAHIEVGYERNQAELERRERAKLIRAAQENNV